MCVRVFFRVSFRMDVGKVGGLVECVRLLVDKLLHLGEILVDHVLSVYS